MREKQFNDLLAVKVPGIIAGLTKAYVPLKSHTNFVYVKDKDTKKSQKVETNVDETKKSPPRKTNNLVVKKHPTIP